MSYPYVQAAYDYGPRKGPTLGLMFHGAEAEAGVVGYLSRSPARGVSANFVCERSGRMVQMLPYTHASGSLNPADRSTNKAYYGRKYLLDVLGSWWENPNAAVISVEIEMYARTGPTNDQVDSLIKWSADMRSMLPDIRGALGHADQTDTKPCPGTTTAMRAVFDAIGGHGLFRSASDVTIQAAGGVKPYTGYEITLSAGRDFFADAAMTQRLGEMSSTQTVPYGGGVIGGGSRLVWVNTGSPYADKQPRWSGVYVVTDAGTPAAVPYPCPPCPECPPPADTSVTYRLEIEGQPVAEGSVTTA